MGAETTSKSGSKSQKAGSIPVEFAELEIRGQPLAGTRFFLNQQEWPTSRPPERNSRFKAMLEGLWKCYD